MTIVRLIALLVGLSIVPYLEAATPAEASPPERCTEPDQPVDLDYASITASIERAFSGGRAPHIFYALGKDRHARLKKLLAGGANPNVCYAGFSPMMIAVTSGDIDEVTILLDGRANPDKPLEAGGGSPLMAALSMKRYPVARLLLERGANPLIVTDGGTTTLHELAIGRPTASDRRERETLARTLVTKSVSVNAATFSGSTPLMLAVAAGDLDLSALLIELGANVHAKNSRGQTAMDIARQKQRDDIVMLLRDHGARP